MKLRLLTHAERDLRGTMQQSWPAFMSQDERLDVLAGQHLEQVLAARATGWIASAQL